MASPQETQHLTRRQRQAQEAQMAHAINQRNHRLRVGGSIASALAVTAIVGFVALHDRYPGPQSPNIPAPITGTLQPGIEKTAMSNMNIVGQEVLRLGIQQNQAEQRRWQTKGYNRSLTKIPLNETAIIEAQRRVAVTLMLMEESNNPYFREAAEYFLPLVRSGEASHSLYPAERLNKGKHSLQTNVINKDGRLHWYIGIAIDEVLYNSDSVVLASELAHEIEHVRNMRKFQESLTSLSIDERIEREIQRQKNPREQIIEEAQAYGIAAQAYIYQAGLLGYVTSGGSIHDERAARFVESGVDINSPSWRNYVAYTLLDISPN